MKKEIRNKIDLIKSASQLKGMGAAIVVFLSVLAFVFTEILYFKKLELLANKYIIFSGVVLIIITYICAKNVFYNTDLKLLSSQICDMYLEKTDYTEVIPNSIRHIKARNSNLVIDEKTSFYAIISQDKIIVTTKKKNFNFIIIDEIKKEEFLKYYSVK